MGCVDRYGLPLTGGADAVAAYNRGVGNLLRLEEGSLHAVAASVAARPDLRARPRRAGAARPRALRARRRRGPAARRPAARPAAAPSASAATSHAVAAHVARRLRARWSRHLAGTPRDALLLSVAVPDDRLRRRHHGARRTPGRIVERCAPAYGDDWWFTGLLAFMRQEQGRFDEAMELSCRSLAVEPGAGHSAHARAHAHYETGDHAAGLAWMDGWITGAGAARRQPQPLLVARRDARAVAGRPRRGPAPLRRPAAPRARAGLPQPGRLRARCCGAGR